jgi:hypothetical protein
VLPDSEMFLKSFVTNGIYELKEKKKINVHHLGNYYRLRMEMRNVYVYKANYLIWQLTTHRK